MNDHFLMSLQSLLCVVDSVIAFWTLCASTLLAHGSNCSVMTSFVFMIAVSSLNISVITSSSWFMPFMNCSFNFLSFSLFSVSTISFTIFWGGRSICQHCNFFLFLVCNIVITKLFHYALAWTFHWILQTVPCLFYACFAPHHLELMQGRVNVGLTNSILSGP